MNVFLTKCNFFAFHCRYRAHINYYRRLVMNERQIQLFLEPHAFRVFLGL
jgi:hypothetical protein